MSRYALPGLALAGLLIAAPPRANGAPAVLDEQALSERIDQLIDERLAKEKVPPAPPADDAEFFRRLSLDLNGRIPSYSQLADFLDDTRKDRRRLWIDELMGGADNGRTNTSRRPLSWAASAPARKPAYQSSMAR